MQVMQRGFMSLRCFLLLGMLQRNGIVIGLPGLLDNAIRCESKDAPAGAPKDPCDFSAYRPLRVVSEGKPFIESSTPAYPADAKKRGTQGVVVVKVLFNQDGIVQKACAVRGDSLLRKAAEEAAIKFRFKPVLINSKKVAFVEDQIVFKFVLDKQPNTK